MNAEMTSKMVWQKAAVLLREPLQSLYLALLVVSGVVIFSQESSRLSGDDVLEEAPPIVYFDEQRIGIPTAPAREEEEQEGEQSAVDGAAGAAGAADDGALAIASSSQSPNWLEYRVRRGDTMDKVLRAIKADNAMRAYLLTQKFKTYRRLRVKSIVYFQQDGNGALSKMLYKTSPDYYFTAGRDELGNIWAREEPPVTQTKRYSRAGVIDSSLFAATDAAGMSERAIAKLVEVLETQIDFYRDVRKGDSFRVVYDEQRDEHGDVIAVEDIIAFEYDNKLKARPRVIRGVYYDDGNGVSGYYTPEGESLQRAFLPAPLKYRRVSSRFSRNRLHPVLKIWRPHRGVDYAAPSGTPVYATADGVVSKVDTQRGYGRVVFIKHFNDVYTTVYAHLRAFRKGIRRGASVKQGEVIGYVGQSGLATGPHLHYEFRVHGKHRDPLSEAVNKQQPSLKGEALDAFRRYSAPLFAELEAIAPAPPRT